MNKLILIILILAYSVFGQNFNDAFRLGQQSLDYDAKTLSLGNSTIGSFGNFSSSLINPGALATIKRDVFTISFNSDKHKNSVDFLNNSSTFKKSSGSINQLSLVMPLPVKKGSAVIAFGYSKLNDFNAILGFDGFNSGNSSMIQNLTENNDDIAYELGLSYPVFNNNDDYLYDETSINGRLNQRGELSEEGSLNSWAFSGAAEVAKNVFVGGTINFISGDYNSNRTYFEEDYSKNIYTGLLDPADSNTLDFQSFYLNDRIKWDISGWDIRIGMLYKINNFINFGANIKLPTYFTIEEKYSIRGESDFSNTYFTIDLPEDVIKYEVTSPMEFSWGISAALPFTTISASAKFVDYSQLEFTEGFDEIDLASMNDDIQEIMESTVNWNIGAEVKLPFPSLKIRGGFIYNPSPYVDDSSEFDRKYITAGLGFPIAKKLLFDFAYVHGWWKNFGDNYSVEVSRTYQDIKVNKMVFSVSYIFM